MPEEQSTNKEAIMPMFDMHVIKSMMDEREVAEAYGIPLDLNLRAAPPDMAMDELPADAIALYLHQFKQRGLRNPFSTLFLSIGKHFRSEHWKERFFLVDRRAAPIVMPLRYHDSSVADLAHLVGTYSEDDVDILSEDPERKVVSMAKFLCLSDWSGTKFGYADLMADGEVLATHTTLPSIERLLNNFTNQPNETNMNDLESDDESVDTPLVSPFPHSDNDSDDDEVLNEFIEYKNAGTLCRERIINSFDRDDLAFQCRIGFRKFTAYLDPFLPMNIISRKAYNTIMVEGLVGMGKNLVAIVKDVYVFVGSFTYITDFVVLEDIGEFITSDMTEVLMGIPFRKITKLKYDVAKGLVSFTKIFNTYTYRMPRIIPRLKNFNWSKVPQLLELGQNDLMSGLTHPHEKNKFMYKNCLNLGPEYQVDESMKEWLIRGHVIFDEKKLGSS
ncbi:hypothetical protein Tco_0770324 [Tanacetum coccineum]|uniref:Uncharacterized protein n=1 Tax=Tanacetum coccineum TaxID=301880 RepID=A0ABQ4ZBX9_9ASTR